MASNLTGDLKSRATLNLQLNTGQKLSLTPVAPAGGTSNYDKLTNLPQINNETLAGNKSAIDLHIVSENSSDGWDVNGMYVPNAGEICMYTDVGRIKIGDGVVPIVDLPFINQIDYENIMNRLREHTENVSVHVSGEDRERWDNKLNYQISGSELIFNRL